MTRLLIIFCLVARCVFGANYFVDFAGGSDAANGLGQGTAWKHSPGDANATGTPAGITLNPLDVVNFKSGVSYNGTVASSFNGVTYQGLSSWGAGVAIMEGTVAGVTNQWAFSIQADSNVVANLTMQDYWSRGVDLHGNNQVRYPVVSNCVISHMGYFPYNISNDGGVGFGVVANNAFQPICVSNLMYDLNEVGIYYVTVVTNGIAWGNTLTNIQDHSVFFNPGGWGLFAFNSVHDQTNLVNHDDGIQINTSDTNIVWGNRFWNNNQDVFFNPVNHTNGNLYIGNNVFLNPGSVDGSDHAFNGINSSPSAPSIYANVYVFNNTFLYKNAGNGGFRIADNGAGIYYTNVYLLNNLFYQSFRSSASTIPSLVLNMLAGYNGYTNSMHGNDPAYGPGSAEINSIYAPLQFTSFLDSAHSTTADLHLPLGSPGSGQGTNLSTLLPGNLWGFLPAPYKIYPTNAADGVARVSSWDMGAFQGATTTGPRVMRVTNLHVGKSYTGP